MSESEDPTVYRRIGMPCSAWQHLVESAGKGNDPASLASDLIMLGLQSLDPPPPKPTFDLAKDFSRYPGGRFKAGGPNSGEELRDDYLGPLLERTGDLVVVNLSSALGVPVSFSEEAFGGLVRKFGPGVIGRIKLIGGEAAEEATRFMAEEAERQA